MLKAVWKADVTWIMCLKVWSNRGHFSVSFAGSTSCLLTLDLSSPTMLAPGWPHPTLALVYHWELSPGLSRLFYPTACAASLLGYLKGFSNWVCPRLAPSACSSCVLPVTVNDNFIVQLLRRPAWEAPLVSVSYIHIQSIRKLCCLYPQKRCGIWPIFPSSPPSHRHLVPRLFP